MSLSYGNILDAPAFPLRGVKHLPGKGSPALALGRLWQEPPCAAAATSILPSGTTQLSASITGYHSPHIPVVPLFQPTHRSQHQKAVPVPFAPNFPLQDHPVAQHGPKAGVWWGWEWTGAAPHGHIHSKVTGMSVKCSQAKGKKTQLGPDRDEQGGLWAGVDAFKAHACAYVAGHGCPHWCTRMCWLHVYVCTSPDLTSKILLVTPAAQQPCPGHPNSTDLFRCSAPPSAAP